MSEEQNTNALYVDLRDPDKDEEVTLELPGSYPRLLDELDKTIKQRGDGFKQEKIRVWAYDPQPVAGKDGATGVQHIPVELFKGTVEQALEHLKQLILQPELVVASLVNHIRLTARHSRLKVVAFNYVLEVSPGMCVTGGNTVVADDDNFSAQDRMMLYGGMEGHLAEIKELAKKAGATFEDDGPQIIVPGR